MVAHEHVLGYGEAEKVKFLDTKIVIIQFQPSLLAVLRSFLFLSVTLSFCRSHWLETIRPPLYQSNYKVISDHFVWGPGVRREVLMNPEGILYI